MKYLLDTCVISELVKPEPNLKVLSWIKSIKEENLYLSVLTMGEIEKGIEKTPFKNRKNYLNLWVENDLKKRFEGRIIPVDLNVSIRWGQIQGAAELSGKTMPVIDGLIAVSGVVHHCIVVTRNTTDMAQSSAELFDPWLDDL